MSEHINAAEIYLRLALKAQTQCRTTVETLIRDRSTFVSQANISSGPQQVNNATPLDYVHVLARRKFLESVKTNYWR
jgi:hypothetical protein